MFLLSGEVSVEMSRSELDNNGEESGYSLSWKNSSALFVSRLSLVGEVQSDFETDGPTDWDVTCDGIHCSKICISDDEEVPSFVGDTTVSGGLCKRPPLRPSQLVGSRGSGDNRVGATGVISTKVCDIGHNWK